MRKCAFNNRMANILHASLILLNTNSKIIVLVIEHNFNNN